MNMKRVHLACALIAVLTAAGSWETARAQKLGSLTTLLETGDRSERINIAFLSEGYTADELSLYPGHATQMLDALLETPPYSDLRGLFNAYAIGIASAESGADHPAQNIFKETFFNAGYDCAGVERLICLAGNGGARAFAMLREHVPEYDIAVIVVNDRSTAAQVEPSRLPRSMSRRGK